MTAQAAGFEDRPDLAGEVWPLGLAVLGNQRQQGKPIEPA